MKSNAQSNVVWWCLCWRQCREALTTRQKLIAQDYKVSYSLAKACKSDLRKYHCSVDSTMPRAREARLSYLLLCLESAVHRGEKLFLFLWNLSITRDTASNHGVHGCFVQLSESTISWISCKSLLWFCWWFVDFSTARWTFHMSAWHTLLLS